LAKILEVKLIYEKEGMLFLGLFGSYEKSSTNNQSNIDFFMN
jgi:predicted nucleotidyltransferase